MALEQQMRAGLRDAVNRSTRKPFDWGGLAGYQQLETWVAALRGAVAAAPDNAYLRQLLLQAERAVNSNRTLAQDVGEAYAWVRRIAACLGYGQPAATDGEVRTSRQVKAAMETLLDQFQPDFKRQPAQTALYGAWRRLWRTWGAELLYCYEIPGLPADNLQLEGFFGGLRRHQRRISGRKSTGELRDFGHCQALFQAESEADLLGQLREAKLADYQAQRKRLAEAEAPRQFLRRLHHDTVKTVRRLLQDYAAHRNEPAQPGPDGAHNT